MKDKDPEIAQDERTPEAHLKELIEIQRKEKEIEEKLRQSRAQAEQIIAAAQQNARELRKQLEAEVRERIEAERDEARRAAEAEAKQIVAAGETQANQLRKLATKRQKALIDQLYKELLGGS
ncbi:MAG: hypothetical protein ACE5JP_06040 [Candidatus Bipolaricaulia bacterium]